MKLSARWINRGKITLLVVHFSLCSCALRLLFTMLLFFFIVPIISFDISLRIYLSTSLSSSKSFFFLSSLLRLHCSSPCQKFLPFSFYKSFLFLFVRIFSKKRKVSVKLFFCESWRREDWFPEYGNFSNFITRGGS